MMMAIMMLELLLMNTIAVARHHKKIGQLMQGVEQKKQKRVHCIKQFFTTSSKLKLTNHSEHIGFVIGSIESRKKTGCGTLKGL
jgi:hypothetical protein